VGDLVCVKLHPQGSKVLNRSAKIADKWSDPFVIAKFLTNVTVQLANPLDWCRGQEGSRQPIKKVLYG
jgi:hypothetical protein